MLIARLAPRIEKVVGRGCRIITPVGASCCESGVCGFCARYPAPGALRHWLGSHTLWTHHRPCGPTDRASVPETGVLYWGLCDLGQVISRLSALSLQNLK